MTTTPKQQRSSTAEVQFPKRTPEELHELLLKVKPFNSLTASPEERKQQSTFVVALWAAVCEGIEPGEIAPDSFEWVKHHMPHYAYLEKDEQRLMQWDDRTEAGLFFHLLKVYGVDVPAQKPTGVLTIDEVKNPSGERFTALIKNTPPKAFAALCRLFAGPKSQTSAIRARANDACHVVGHVRMKAKQQKRQFVEVKLVSEPGGRKDSLADLMLLDVDTKHGRARSSQYLTEILEALVKAGVLAKDPEGRYGLGSATWR